MKRHRYIRRAEEVVTVSSPSVEVRTWGVDPFHLVVAQLSTPQSWLPDPIAVGMALVALTHMSEYTSGAHYNPALSLVMERRRVIDLKTLAVS